MTTSHARGIKEDGLNDLSVAEYLQTYPDFFERNGPLLAKLRLPHLRDAGTTVSLVERQVEVLRERTQSLERKLKELVDVARANDALAELRNDVSVVVQDEAAQALQAISDRQALDAERSKVEGLREQRSRADTDDVHAQARLDLQIDLEQLGIDRLEARLAGRSAVLATAEDSGEADRGRRMLVYGLEALIRELESLSRSARYARMREVWDARCRDARILLAAWRDAGADLRVERMEVELSRERERTEKRFTEQDSELIDLSRWMYEADDARLETTQILDSLMDPRNRDRVENWAHACEDEYQLLVAAREQGDHVRAGEHSERMMQLRQRTQELKLQEDQARVKTDRAVVSAMLVAVFVVVVLLVAAYQWHWDGGVIPGIGVPFSVPIWSAVGAVAAMLYQFLNRPVSQLEVVKWLVARPMQGLIMGSFLYLVVAAGVLVLGTSGLPPADGLAGLVRPQLAGVVAFLGGFSDRFADEMVRRATSILAPNA